MVIDDNHNDINFDNLASKVDNIEAIDLTSGTHTINNISLGDVIATTNTTNDLVFVGDSDDKVDLSKNEDWIKSDDKVKIENVDGDFIEYTHKDDPTAKLFIDEDITVI